MTVTTETDRPCIHKVTEDLELLFEKAKQAKEAYDDAAEAYAVALDVPPTVLKKYMKARIDGKGGVVKQESGQLYDLFDQAGIMTHDQLEALAAQADEGDDIRRARARRNAA